MLCRQVPWRKGPRTDSFSKALEAGWRQSGRSPGLETPADNDASSLHLFYNRESQPVIPAKENTYQLTQKHAEELTTRLQKQDRLSMPAGEAIATTVSKASIFPV